MRFPFIERLFSTERDERVFRPEPDEIINSITHALGLVLSLIGGVVMAVCVVSKGDAWRIGACGVYVATLIAVYGCSTLSHSVATPHWKRRFRILDQAFIYLLIVGTYTPFGISYLNSGGWWYFLVLLWTIAVVGFLSKILFAHRIDGVAIWLYVLLGWLHVLAAFPLAHLVPAQALWWMLYGGLCYTIGTLFLINDHRATHFHAIWHLLVIAGSTWHFFAILLFVAMA